MLQCQTSLPSNNETASIPSSIQYAILVCRLSDILCTTTADITRLKQKLNCQNIKTFNMAVMNMQ